MSPTECLIKKSPFISLLCLFIADMIASMSCILACLSSKDKALTIRVSFTHTGPTTIQVRHSIQSPLLLCSVLHCLPLNNGNSLYLKHCSHLRASPWGRSPSKERQTLHPRHKMKNNGQSRRASEACLSANDAF